MDPKDFSDLEPLFAFGIWKILSGVSNKTSQLCSIWLLDSDLLKKYEPDKQERQKVFNSIHQCLSFQKDIHDKGVLEIYELYPADKNFGFVAEPFFLSLSFSTKFSSDEQLFVTTQICDIISFLHSKNIIVNSIFPDNFVLTRNFSVKIAILSAFQFGDDSSNSWNGRIFQTPIQFCSTEVVQSQKISFKSDIFSLGLVLYFVLTHRSFINISSREDYVSQDFTRLGDISRSYLPLIQNCLVANPVERPAFDTILVEQPFDSISGQVFFYLNQVEVTKPKKLFSFFNGLRNQIFQFSFRLQRFFFLPFFIDQIRLHADFGSLLIPFIFQIGKSLKKRDFLNEVVKPLNYTFKSSEEISLLEFYLSEIPQLFEFELTDQVFSIISSSLSSSSPSLHSQAIKALNSTISHFTSGQIQQILAPILVDIFSKTLNISLQTSILSFFPKILSSVGPDFQGQRLFPSILKKIKVQDLSDSSEEIFLLLQSSTIDPNSKMTVGIPIASVLLSNQAVRKEVQGQLFSWVQQILIDVQTARGFGGKSQNLNPGDSIPRPSQTPLRSSTDLFKNHGFND